MSENLGVLVMKKDYKKPQVKTVKVQLGVFGDYTDRGGDTEIGMRPVPVKIISDLNLRME